MRIHNGGHWYTPYICDVCGRGFRLSQGLDKHMRTHPSGDLYTPYTCDVCGRGSTQSLQ